LNRGTAQERNLGKIDMVLAEKDDVVTILTAGGGGFGDPFVREIAAVKRDVRAGFVSPAAAERDYGVVIRNGVLDHDATDARRRSRAPRHAGFDFGPERDAWEQVFDDPIMTALATRLLALPAAVRAQARRRIIEAVVPGIERVGEVELQDLITDPAAQRARLQELIDGLPTP
jgi:N-methylhydantoinase B